MSKLPRHQFWGAGEPDCPADLKAPNGELHTTRCKVCGDGWRKSHDVCLAAIRPPEPVGYVSRGSLSNVRIGRQDAASIYATSDEVGETDAVAVYVQAPLLAVSTAEPQAAETVAREDVQFLIDLAAQERVSAFERRTLVHIARQLSAARSIAPPAAVPEVLRQLDRFAHACHERGAAIQRQDTDRACQWLTVIDECRSTLDAALSAAPEITQAAPQRDNCEVCHGERGGVPGNENRVHGTVMCDYCHAETLRAAPQAAGAVTEEQIDRALSTPIPGGSLARDWFLPHDHPKGIANVRDVVRRMIDAARSAIAPQQSPEDHK